MECGVEKGKPVGILLERSLETYIALLRVLKSGTAFVPLDPSFPPDRVAFIAEDAELQDLVTTTAFREKTQTLSCPVLELDEATEALAVQPETRPQISIHPLSLCYIIYTSGSTGRPKGVAVSHDSITNFLRVVTPIYDVRSDDRVYQGMTIAFDFSFEEIWPTWIAGAVLIAGPTDSRRLGHGLTEFLIEHKISVLCCVPTLLATIDRDEPTLSSLLVGGEACPGDLIRRWSRPGRRMLNTYGPTEATVTAIWCELFPNRPVTIGRPLPSYRVYILDDQLSPIKEGESGEICIGGPGVAIGYINRPDLTEDRFVPNPIRSDWRDAARLYRTGDLGRYTSSGEIEYLGRIDTQVKIRGYRIELGEIEEVIREDWAVENAVVKPLEIEGIVQDLVAYVTLHDQNGEAVNARDADLRERLHASLRSRLPAYMVPSFIEVLKDFPLLAADKVNRAALPPPASTRLSARSTLHVASATPLERQLAEAWEQVLGYESVSVEDDFFRDLGGHSLAAAPCLLALALLIGIYIMYLLAQLLSPIELLVLMPALTMGIGMATILIVVLLKWLLVGRYHERVEPLWSVFVRRTEFITGLYESLAVPVLVGGLAGTPWIASLLRLFGARIGRRVWLASTYLTEFDLVEVGDDAAVCEATSLQTHLFEDRVMKMSTVKIGAGSSIGSRSVVLYDTEVGEGASLDALSLVMKGESLPAQSLERDSRPCQLRMREVICARQN